MDNYNKAELNFTNKKDSEILIDCMNKIYNKFNVDPNEILNNEKNQDFDKLFFVKDKVILENHC